MKFQRSINTAKANCLIQIRLDDECKNGHEDFAITATFWQIGKPRTDHYFEMGGCCQEEILKLCPEYLRFVNLHLCDFNGAPMYAVGNGLYHAQPGQYHAENAGPESLASYFRIPVWMAEKLCVAGDERHFTWLIEEFKVDEMWKMEADAAIAQLERMTGEKFVSKATKSHFSRLVGDDRKMVMGRLKAGFYSLESIARRKKEDREELIKKLVAAEKEKQDDQLEAINTTATVNMALLTKYPEKQGNWWYWHQDRSIKFNDGHAIKFSPEEIEEAVEMLSALVPEIKVTIKKS